MYLHRVKIICFSLFLLIVGGLVACKPALELDRDAAYFAMEPRHIKALAYIEIPYDVFSSTYYTYKKELNKELVYYKESLGTYDNKHIIKIQKAILAAIEKEIEALAEEGRVKEEDFNLDAMWHNHEIDYEELLRRREAVSRDKAKSLHLQARQLAAQAYTLLLIQDIGLEVVESD